MSRISPRPFSRRLPSPRPSARRRPRRFPEHAAVAPRVARRDADGASRDTGPASGCQRRAQIPRRCSRERRELLLAHSVFNGHPRFMGYITSSAAPLGWLAELLVSTVNPNCGSWGLSPMATLIEEQTVAWIGELVGAPHACGGLLVSGGNMANMVGFWAARTARGAVGREAARAECPWRVQAGRVLFRRDPHVDPEGRGSERPWHRRRAVDRRRRPAPHGRRRARRADRRRPRRAA